MNLKEHIRKVLKEETLKETLLSEMKRSGVRDTANLMSLEPKELLEMVGLKGTQEDMILLTKIILDNDVKKKLKICNYYFVPTQYSLNIYVQIPKPLPEHEGRYMYDQRLRTEAYELISKLIFKLSGGLIRGHSIDVFNTGEC